MVVSGVLRSPKFTDGRRFEPRIIKGFVDARGRFEKTIGMMIYGAVDHSSGDIGADGIII